MVASNSSSPAKKVSRAEQVRLDVATRCKIRNLYLVQDLAHKDIALRVGLTVKQVGIAISRAGLPKIKRENIRRSEEAHDARARQGIDEISEAIAAQSEEIALNGLTRAREEAESDGEFAARNFQSWTGGVSNLVKTARACRGMDAKSESLGAVNVSLYMVRGEVIGEQSSKPMKNVGLVTTAGQPAINV